MIQNIQILARVRTRTCGTEALARRGRRIMNAIPTAEPHGPAQAEPEAPGRERRSEARPMPMCPMAATCKGMMARPLSGTFLLVPGLLFVAFGVLIAIVPAVLAWMVAALCVLMGLMMLSIGVWMRRLGARMRRTEDTAL
jgi:hypothetical protein